MQQSAPSGAKEFQLKGKAAAGAIVLALLLGYAFGQGGGSNGTRPAPASGGDWQRVATFEGTGDRSTPEFTVNGSQWRIRYQTTLVPRTSSCSFYGRVRGLRGTANQEGFSAHRSETNESLYRSRGTYFVEVSSLYCDWQLTIEDYR